MARAIWTGAISFGLVSIPVQVHTVVRESRPASGCYYTEDRRAAQRSK